MISYYYAGYDGYNHHGSISDEKGGVDQIFICKTEEDLWSNVIEYVEDNYNGRTEVKISGGVKMKKKTWKQRRIEESCQYVLHQFVYFVAERIYKIKEINHD
jgi:hypothetical protein